MFDILMSGTSATLVIQLPKRAYIGWVGDSQATVWSGGNNVRATTEAHQPSAPAEMHRIYDNRGEIREAEDGRQRIFLRARMYPGLKVSRTIGDLISHQIGVISQPNTQIVDFKPNDKLLVVGTAGLW